jgi:hypothetical protein
MRTDITFHSGDDWCAGWLYRPEGFEGPRPLMVMAGGEALLGELADRLQHRGMARPHLSPPLPTTYCSSSYSSGSWAARTVSSSSRWPTSLPSISRLVFERRGDALQL